MFKNFRANPEYVPGGVHNFWTVHPPRTEVLPAVPKDYSGRTNGGGGGFAGGFFTNNSAAAVEVNNNNSGFAGGFFTNNTAAEAESNNNNSSGMAPIGGMKKTVAANGNAAAPVGSGKIEEKFGGIGNLIGAFFSNHTM